MNEMFINGVFMNAALLNVFNGVNLMSLPGTRPDILLVEDDISLAEWIIQYLQGHDFTVRHIARGDHIVASVKQQAPELIILDVMLPYKNGFDICRELRGFYTNPILM